MIVHVSTKSADYWACETLGEINFHQQWHRPVICIPCYCEPVDVPCLVHFEGLIFVCHIEFCSINANCKYVN